MADEILYEERDGIAIIAINRPDKKNTLTDAVVQGIADGIDRAARSKDVSRRSCCAASATRSPPATT